MIYLRRLTSFIKFNIYDIVPKPCEWIFSAFFNCLHLYANLWFSWHMLSEMKSLPVNFSWLRFSDLLRRFFLSIRIFRFCYLDLNFRITISFFSRRWHAWRSSRITSWPVRERALQTLSYSSSLLIDAGTGFISINLWQWYWALLTAFLSSWTIHSLRSRLQFFETASSEDKISSLLIKSSNLVVSFTSLDSEGISSMLISSSINSSFERCSNWLLVRTTVKDNLKYG